MTPALRAIGIVQSLALLALVAMFLHPQAPSSLRWRLPVAIVAFVASAAHLLLTIL